MIKIIIHDSSKLNIINIQIIDNGIGMDKTTVKNVIDPFYTTRTTRKVGLGVPMLRRKTLKLLEEPLKSDPKLEKYSCNW